MIRRLPFRAMSTSWFCRSMRSGSPVSAKPEENMWTTLTPLARHSSSSAGVYLAGIDTMTWSTSPGTSVRVR